MTTHRIVLAAVALLGICLHTVCLGQSGTGPAPTQQPPKPAPPARLPGPGQAGRPGQPAWTAPPPLLSPLDVKLDVRAAIEDAKKQAESKGGRVLVIWAADPEARPTQSLVEATRAEDVRKMLGLEFAVVWAEIGKAEQAAANRELAKSLGASVTASDTHATLTVLDAAGKPLGSKSAATMADEVRTGAYSVLKIQDFLIPLRAPTPEAKATMDGAIAKAKPGSRGVLLVFGEFGDDWTAKFRRWLVQPEVERALAASTVIAHVELLRDKGAFELMESLGGVRVQSLPWYAVLGPDGRVAGVSQAEKTPNIGFPTDDGEIGMFLDLLRKGNPRLSEGDAKALRESLVAFRERKGR